MITEKELEFANLVLKSLYPKHEFELESFDTENDALFCYKLPLNIWQSCVKKYVLQEARTIHGCMYMPNGDPGYPDDVDIVDISEYDSFNDALFALFIENAKIDIENAFYNARDEMEYRDDELEPPHEADFRDLS